MTDLMMPGAGHAQVSWGRWVVECANPYCRSALTLGPDAVDQAGELQRGLAWGQQWMRCWDCGAITEPIVWPVDRDAIQMLLRRRPDPRTRNWLPGETLDDLLTENLTHGLIPHELDVDGPDACVMQTVNGRLTGGLLLDALPDAEKRRALTGGMS